MDSHTCPQKNCGSPARLLFNLVCSNPSCRNYDAEWYQEINSIPRFKHETIGKHFFLGGFLYNSTYYDLYHSINPLDENEWVEARYGDDITCYLGEELIFAPFHTSIVLKEAAKRWDELQSELH